jgi:hypothetical protein
MKHASVAQRVDATYSYRDEQGKELYQVVRFHPKGFASGAEMRAGTLSGTWKVRGGSSTDFQSFGRNSRGGSWGSGLSTSQRAKRM